MQSQRWILWEIQDHPGRLALIVVSGLFVGFAAHALSASFEAVAETPVKPVPTITKTVFPVARIPALPPRRHYQAPISPKHTATRHSVAPSPTHAANPTPTPTLVPSATPQPSPSIVVSASAGPTGTTSAVPPVTPASP